MIYNLISNVIYKTEQDLYHYQIHTLVFRKQTLLKMANLVQKSTYEPI
jgi:hypothetical protein